MATAKIKKSANKSLACDDAEKDKLMLVDSDKDGLSDWQEILYGTDPYKADTDDDGLSDYEELKVYRSNPLDPDTNHNGIADGREVSMGRNPSGKGSLKDVFIGSAANSYMPAFLKKERLLLYGVSAVALKVIVFAFVILLPLSAWVTPDVLSDQAKEIIKLTNELRASAGVSPLATNDKLMATALDKAQDMMAGQYFAHTGPDGKNVVSWLKKNDYRFDVAGENLAMGFSSPADVVNAWVKSPTHYANIVDPSFKQIGVGLAVGEYQGFETTLVVQTFGTPKVTREVDDLFASSTTIERSQTKVIGSAKSEVLGVKLAGPLSAPTFMSPMADYLSGKSDVAIKVYAPQAAKLQLFDGSNLLGEYAADADSLVQTNAALNEGNHQLLAVSINGKSRATSTPISIMIDSQAPQVDLSKTQVMVSDSSGDQKLVRAIVYLTPDAKEAEVSFGNYRIKLQPAGDEPGKWTGSAIIFNQQEEQIFSPVVLPVLTAKDGVGNSKDYDLAWSNVKPVKNSVLNQYFWAKGNHGRFNWLFDISSVYYKILFGLMALVFALNLINQIRQHIAYFNWRFILSAAALIILLLMLIIV